MNAHIPPGFVLVPFGPEQGYVAINGPLYAKREEKPEGRRLVLAFRVEQRHTNPAGMCHGGMLMTFCDMQLPIASQYQTEVDQFLPTVSMTCDFLAPAPLGSWIEGRAEVLKVTKNLVFAHGLVTVDGEVVVRTSGTFKRGPKFDDLGVPRIKNLLP